MKSSASSSQVRKYKRRSSRGSQDGTQPSTPSDAGDATGAAKGAATPHKVIRWTMREGLALREAVTLYGTRWNEVCAWGIRNGRFHESRTAGACHLHYHRLNKLSGGIASIGSGSSALDESTTSSVGAGDSHPRQKRSAQSQRQSNTATPSSSLLSHNPLANSSGSFGAPPASALATMSPPQSTALLVPAGTTVITFVGASQEEPMSRTQSALSYATAGGILSPGSGCSPSSLYSGFSTQPLVSATPGVSQQLHMPTASAITQDERLSFVGVGSGQPLSAVYAQHQIFALSPPVATLTELSPNHVVLQSGQPLISPPLAHPANGAGVALALVPSQQQQASQQWATFSPHSQQQHRDASAAAVGAATGLGVAGAGWSGDARTQRTQPLLAEEPDTDEQSGDDDNAERSYIQL